MLLSALVTDPVTEELEQRRIGVHDREVRPAVLVEVQSREGPSVGRIVQARDAGVLQEIPPLVVEEEVVALVSAQGRPVEEARDSPLADVEALPGTP